jgi:hypothetical protein
MITDKIELIAIETAHVRSLKALIHLEVKDFEPESLCLPNFFGVPSDLDLQVADRPAPGRFKVRNILSPNRVH